MIFTFRELLYLPFVTNLRCIHNQAMSFFSQLNADNSSF